MAAIDATNNNDYVSSLQKSTSAATSAPSNELDQNDFLRLITTQMTNQDPTSPMDPTAFVTDLTQMQQLDATTRMNDSIAAMTQSFQSMQMMQSASLLGKSVQVDGNVMSYKADQDALFKVESDQALEEVKVVISQENGDPVRTLDVGSMAEGEKSLTWDGLDDEGFALPAGQYKVTAYGNDADGEVQSLKSIVPSSVNSLSVNSDGSVNLTLASGETLSMASVREIGL